MSLIGRGATGTVYQLNSLIAVKRARQGEDEEADHASEQATFKILEKNRPIPYLIRCFYQTRRDTFLELAPNGSLAMLLSQHQVRDSRGYQVLNVSQTLDWQDVNRWMKQLCIAAASLERVELCHGDIRPGNMLLDADRNLKLCDFDRATRIGEDVTVLTEPFGRLLDGSDGAKAGPYGQSGPRTESFAIGSVYYTLTRGYEPYETEEWGRDHFVTLAEKFQRKDFPPLTSSAADRIIRKCWDGKYGRVRELLIDVPEDDPQEGSVGLDPQWLDRRQLECKKLVQSGVIDVLDRY